MAFKQSDVDALNEAIATGELSVEYNGRKTAFRSIDQLIQAKEHIEKELFAASGGRRRLGMRVRVNEGR